MKIVGLMLVRNEDWILDLSVRAAMSWCDELVVFDHASTDRTSQLLFECDALHSGSNYHYLYLGSGSAACWNEMELRQQMLEAGRNVGGTHFALIDADEVLTGNLLPHIRGWVEQLAPGQVLNLPMIPTWRSLYHYRQDASVWSRSSLSVAFCDKPGLCWHTREGGYEHHHRTPHGIDRPAFQPDVAPLGGGGVFHLQFANWKRLVAKHALYKMTERIRWPDLPRCKVAALNKTYGEALDETDIRTVPVPSQWWAPYSQWLSSVVLDGEPWQAAECRRLLEEHGPEPFAGLDLFGVV